MVCNKCGSHIPEGNAFCGVCGMRAAVQTKPQPDKEEKRGFFKVPGKYSKSFAAIATALMVFPATFCVAIDLVFQSADGWSLYVVGALITAWMVVVYPALNITPAPVTVMISFFSIVGYIFFVMGRLGYFETIYKAGLPLMILGAIFIALDSTLISAGKLKGLHTFSFISLQCAVYLVAIEAVFDNLADGEIALRWSLIIGCFFISAIALFEAVNYVYKLNKK
ncbi:MAG: zinc ribbon domain-containing protein [Clostridia bacterium]|nr:zinc ribbon domain-containing protein [Clostridia bacterium]